MGSFETVEKRFEYERMEIDWQFQVEADQRLPLDSCGTAERKVSLVEEVVVKAY